MSKKDIFKSLVDKTVTNIIIPNNITSIGDFSFINCTSLISATIPKNIKIIGNSAFSFCSKLTNINIEYGIEIIGNSAFSSCSKLEEITIPDSVTTIGASVFMLSSKLTNVTIGSGVNTFGKTVFSNSNGALYVKTITFNQPSGMAITLPSAGSSNGLFYCKTASNLTVYTDNETIKNYDYATDNVTPTFYHLDGTLWE